MRFDRLLREAIDNSIGGQSDDKSLDDILSEIRAAESYIDSLKGQLEGKFAELSATLSAELKKLLPKVDAKLGRGSVIFSYYSRSVGVRPDMKDGTWKVESGPGARDRAMVRKFADEWDGTPLSDWKELAHAIAEIFVGNYKTLQGGKVELPTEEEVQTELPDEMIDQALDTVDTGATSPPPVNGRAIERKGTSLPGKTYYA